MRQGQLLRINGWAKVTRAIEHSHDGLLVYDNFGGRVVLDIYFSKTADNTWEVAVYDQADAAPDTSFPYASGPMVTETLAFDPANGRLDAASASSIRSDNRPPSRRRSKNAR